jgi:hypothetical protein
LEALINYNVLLPLSRLYAKYDLHVLSSILGGKDRVYKVFTNAFSC